MARPRSSKSAHLPRYLHQKHGAYWHVRHGKWSRLADNVADALVALGRMQGAKVGEAMPADDSALTVVGLLGRALPIILKDVAAETARKYREASRKLQELFPTGNAVDLRAKHIYAVRDSLIEHPVTFNLLRAVLRLSLDWAVRSELLEVNPAISVKRLPTTPRKRYISDQEYAAIYGRASDLIQVVMELCYRTGQRIGDVLHIKLADCQAEGILFVQQKTGSRVTAGWTPELRAVVARAKTLRADNVVSLDAGYLLAWRGAKTYLRDTVHDAWREAVDAAGVKDVHLHDLRAKAATDVHRAGGLIQAQHLLGHKTQAMTTTYLRDLAPNVVQGPTAERPARKRKGEA